MSSRNSQEIRIKADVKKRTEDLISFRHNQM